MKKLLLVIEVMLLIIATAYAQDATLGPHDLKDAAGVYMGCLSCHHPHAAPQDSGKTMLFRWALSTYGPYSTYDAVLLNKPTGPDDAQAQSYLCLSCHDNAMFTSGGGSAISSNFFAGTTPPNLIGTDYAGNTGKTLESQHPVNHVYGNGSDMTTPVADASGGYTVGTGNLPLYGGTSADTATVQCTSCHNQHNNANVPFLRMANVGNTALCRNCHSAI